MAASPAPDRKLTLFLGGQLIPLALEEIDQVLDAIVNQKLASRNPTLLRCCFIENVNWVRPAGQVAICPILSAEAPAQEAAAG